MLRCVRMDEYAWCDHTCFTLWCWMLTLSYYMLAADSYGVVCSRMRVVLRQDRVKQDGLQAYKTLQLKSLHIRFRQQCMTGQRKRVRVVCHNVRRGNSILDLLNHKGVYNTYMFLLFLLPLHPCLIPFCPLFPPIPSSASLALDGGQRRWGAVNGRTT